jgi:hypothetical protein
VYGAEFDSLDPNTQAECENTARERLFAYIMLRQSNKTNSKLKTDLHDDFGKGQDNYPKTRSETLRLLDVHTKTSIDTRVAPATTFAQRRGTNNNKKGTSQNIMTLLFIILSAPIVSYTLPGFITPLLSRVASENDI